MTQESALPLPPGQIRVGDAWQFGRYVKPFAHPDFGNPLLTRFRLKEWHYSSFATDDWFFAVGLVQLGYVANAFAYLVDRRRPTLPARQFEALSPLGSALRFAPSSIEGTTCWERRNARVEFEWMAPEWRVKLDVPFGKTALRGELRLASADALALLHPLAPDRPAYTHKAAGMKATGVLDLGDQRLDFRDAFGTLDWTRSLANRETRWKWASFAGRNKAGDAVGLNLSAEVYDDAAGDSRENGFWLNGKVAPLGGVTFEVPKDPGVNDWRIVSRDQTGGRPEVDLSFEPFGARRQNLDLRLVRSDFIQPYGVFRGQVLGHDVQDVFGVVEDHLAVW
ncbi:MAG: DUF2804 domain-containing protein [Myxococcales bacterium]|nr:DUF2804 domain-containing protein [Myxococcales bacterium]MCB9627743.1 DUF2804 domain-containing protein [Sandaracinaceae bacterium]